MGNIVETVGKKIQNAILTTIGSTITPKIELALRSINASSGQNATSGMPNSEAGEQIGITLPFENASERNITPNVFNKNDETRRMMMHSFF